MDADCVPAPKSVAIVVSAFNESECINELIVRLGQLFALEREYSFICYLVDNGSTDETWAKIEEQCSSDSRFRGLRLSRNFGADGGFSAGLSEVQEDACILMAADLQDPPEFVPQMLRAWEAGFENVYAIISERQGTGPIRRLNSQIFYWVTSRWSDFPQPRNVSDFRLLSRRAYCALRHLPETERYLRGLSAWIGFPSVGIELIRPPRYSGVSKASTTEVMRVATRGLLSNSTRPLRLITLIGLASLIGSVALISVLAVLWVLRGVPFAGFGTLLSVNLLIFGALAFMIGLVAEYVGLIYAEVRRRPSFVIQDKIRGDPE